MFYTKGIVGSGMVLQRDRVNCVTGISDKKRKIILEFRDKIYETIADNKGNWKIEYNPGNAGGPYIMRITCNDETIIYKDILVGEVWFLSGQSNAQLPMERLKFSYRNEFKKNHNEIRMLTVPIRYSFNGEQDKIEKTEWLTATKENLNLLSGTGYFFAKKLNEELKVPVGVVNASQGGSPITSWMNYDSLNVLDKNEYTSRIEKWRNDENVIAAREDVQKKQKIWDNEIFLSDIGTKEHWEKLSYSDIKNQWNEEAELPGDLDNLNDKAGILWLKKEIILTNHQVELLNKKKSWIWFGTIVDADKIWINDNFCGVTYYTYPPRRYELHENCFKEGKNTITVRVQKNGTGPIRFFKEKPYFIFTDNIIIPSCASRNVENELKNNISSFSGEGISSSIISTSDSVIIDVSGKWLSKAGCILNENRPEELFFEWEPSALYNSMLAPCFDYAISGAIWYQGESNAWKAEEYSVLLKKLIELWREKFKYASENMPVVVMQLPNWTDGNTDESKNNFGDWPLLREMQKKAVNESANTGIVNLIDAGEWNDLHPEKKKTGGFRAAIEALRLAYNKNYSEAPVCAYCQKEGKFFAVRFDCGTSALAAYKVNNETVDFGCRENKVYGFEFLCGNGNIVPAEAVLISKNDVHIYIPEGCNDLQELRFLWKPNPWIVNLYSEDGLPAMAFRVKLIGE